MSGSGAAAAHSVGLQRGEIAVTFERDPNETVRGGGQHHRAEWTVGSERRQPGSPQGVTDWAGLGDGANAGFEAGPIVRAVRADALGLRVHTLHDEAAVGDRCGVLQSAVEIEQPCAQLAAEVSVRGGVVS